MAKAVELDLPENMTIASVSALHEDLEAMVEKNDSDAVLIKSASVARADTAGVQLLLAFVNTAKEHQLAVTWDSPSDCLRDAAVQLGVDRILGIH